MLLSSACSSIKPLTVDSKPIERTPLALPVPAPLDLNLPNWKVITPDNIAEVWKELAANGQSIVLFAITAEGLEQLTLDLAQIKNLINEQRVIIIQYKEYYEKQENKK